MSKLKIIFASVMMMVGLMATPLMSVTVSAAPSDPQKDLCIGSGGRWTGTTCTGQTKDNTDLGSFIKKVVNIIVFVVGAVAVLMIVIGGLRYTISSGDQAAVTSAKNTILYAVVGLIVAVMAYAIVNFVVGTL